MKKNKKSKNKRLLIAVISVLVAVCLAFFAYQSISNNNSDKDQAYEPESGVDYGPPTEQEQKSGDLQKEDISKEEEQDDSSSEEDIVVIITDAAVYDGTVEIRAFIPNYYEDGTCTLTFKKGSNSLIKHTPAYKDASTTICTNPLINKSEFPASGTWNLTVDYKSSDGATASSDERTIEI